MHACCPPIKKIMHAWILSEHKNVQCEPKGFY